MLSVQLKPQPVQPFPWRARRRFLLARLMSRLKAGPPFPGLAGTQNEADAFFLSLFALANFPSAAFQVCPCCGVLMWIEFRCSLEGVSGLDLHDLGRGRVVELATALARRPGA